MNADDYSFPRNRRITSPQQFQAVYDANVSVHVGPLLVRGRPNDLDHPRLGLAVSRRVGNAVVRNWNKRLLREAFRLVQHELPTAYDLVVSVRAHEPKALCEYKALLLEAARRLEGIWNKRHVRNDAVKRPPPQPGG